MYGQNVMAPMKYVDLRPTVLSMNNRVVWNIVRYTPLTNSAGVPPFNTVPNSFPCEVSSDSSLVDVQDGMEISQ